MGSALQNGSPDGGAGRPRARHALGPGLAAGDRPRAVRRAAHALGGHGRLHRRTSPPRWTRPSPPPPGPPSGPAFLDFPLDHVFMESDVDADAAGRRAGPPRPAGRGGHRAGDRAAARRRAPGDHGRHRPLLGPRRGRPARAGRGAADPGVRERVGPRLPARRPRAGFSRARGKGLKEADVALVVGVPMDFRLGFGGSFGDDTQIVLARLGRARPRAAARAAVELYGGIPATLDAMREGAGGRPRPLPWVAALRETEDEKRAGEQEELTDERAPLHPLRLYHELAGVLDRDAVVIGDGGDFVSYAGRVIETYEPGCWMDPGPFGCLGSGPGYALAAKLANPDRQVCLLLGDGAFGFAGHGVRHARAPRRAGRGRDGQQRDLGAGEAPDGVPLRLLGGRRAAARVPLRPGGRGPRRPRRAGARARRAARPRSSGRSPVGQAGAGERAHRPRRSPTRASRTWPEATPSGEPARQIARFAGGSEPVPLARAQK